MRYSLHKHVLAILRETIGMKQPAFAELLGCSLSAVQSVEVGRLKLSENLAQRISFTTGVGVGWLLSNDVSTPPFNNQGQPFTKEVFEKIQAERSRPKIRFHDIGYVLQMTRIAAWRIAASMVAAYEKDNFTLCDYKVFQACNGIAYEFGESTKMGIQSDGSIRSPTNFTEIGQWASAELKRLRAEKERILQVKITWSKGAKIT